MIIVYPNGGFLFGNFDKNRLEGAAINLTHDNTIVAGYWKQSNMHGSCFHYNPDKKVWTHTEYSNGIVMKYINEERIVNSDYGLANTLIRK